jgi:MFS family permease
VRLGFAAASAVCFLCATGLGRLYAGRLLSGLSGGLFTGAATAYGMELAPNGGASRATFVATAANMGGLGCGPLLSGVLAQYADWPLYLPFVTHLVLVAGSAAVLLRLAETVRERKPPHRTAAGPRTPPQVRAVFTPAAIASFVGFALFGVFTSVSPEFLAESLHVDGHAVSGLVVALAFFASTAGQLAVGPVGVRRSLPLGCAGLLAGPALLAGALRWELMSLVVLSALVGGVGQGLAFRGALSEVAGASPAQQRAAVISTLFVVAYAGISLPVIGVGLLTDPLGLEGAGLVFIAAWRSWCRRRPSTWSGGRRWRGRDRASVRTWRHGRAGGAGRRAGPGDRGGRPGPGDPARLAAPGRDHGLP